MDICGIIEKKKKGRHLNADEIDFFIKGVTGGGVPDYQASALLMAVCLKGMTDEEAFHLTKSMIESGKVLKRGSIEGICVDKHSTGGVSDSTTLVITPVLCELGLTVAKLSGRGLGHTGGTLDKLESFSGFNVNLSGAEFERVCRSAGGAVAGQTEETVPADKKLYALRDVTCTVDSIPLIASSIMSKKLASFADVILLDVKYGKGGFMKTLKEAKALAELMVNIGKRYGRKAGALITSMEQPLGDTIGCNLEVMGAIDVLKGRKNDLYTVSKELCAKILELAGMGDKASLIDRVIESGKGLERLERIIKSQGGTGAEIYDCSLFKGAESVLEIRAESSGFVYGIDGESLGAANVMLGGGRRKKEDEIDRSVGIKLLVRLNDRVEKGDILALVYHNGKGIREARQSIIKGISIKDRLREIPSLIAEYIC